MVLEPSLAEKLYTKLLEYVRECEINSMPAIMLVANDLRGMLEKLFRPTIPTLHFLGQNEIPEDKQLTVAAKIG